MRGGSVAAILLVGVAAGLLLSRTETVERLTSSSPRSTAEPHHKPVPVVDEGEEFTCTPERVWDGDGPLWCKEGPRVRLAGIAAREIGEGCRPYHPCPEATAELARDQLVKLVGEPVGTSREGHILVEGPPLKCRSDGSGKGSRTAAWCETQAGVDLNCAMVDSGVALKWERYWGGHSCG